MLFRRRDGEELDIARLKPNSEKTRSLRGGDIAMIFQEPMASFSPVYSIGNQMIEAIRLHRGLDKKDAREVAIEMLNRVGISNAGLRVDQYPHELSGGMRQRAMIALALSTHPSLLIADEPTTALDVTIQAQILELMNELQDEFGMSIIFITHDMGVIAQVADSVSVMYLGRIAEAGTTQQVIFSPKHPYSEGLLEAIPTFENLDERLKPVPGDIPSPLERPTGCPFHPRCPRAQPGLCDRELPPEIALSASHTVSCVLYGREES
jgi:peptide/nickel transport system ATP-binding protein